jgi:hypothetical protein
MGRFSVITPVAAAPALFEAREGHRAAFRAVLNQQAEYRNANNNSELPELEEVGQQTVSDADSSASGAEQANEPSFELCPAEAMSDRARALARSALSDPEAFSHMQLSAVEGVELWDLLLSLTINQFSAACEIPRTCDLLSRHGTILVSPLQELINAIRKNHLARKLKKRLETAPIVSLNPMNMAPFELQWLIGQGRVTALQSRTPPTDVIFAAIEMTLRRFFPKDCQRILLQMKSMGLSAKDYMNLVKNKGKLAVWIYTKSGLQGLEQYTPQIYDLGVIQEQVDEEENARIEEISLGGSLTLPLPPEANTAIGTAGEQRGYGIEASVEQEVEFNLEEVVEETLHHSDRKRTLFEDLDPLDPISNGNCLGTST